MFRETMLDFNVVEAGGVVEKANSAVFSAYITPFNGTSDRKSTSKSTSSYYIEYMI